MSQITWKNIAAPEFKGAMYGMDRAAETLQGAFDPLDKLMKERKALDEQNFQTGIKNNDRAIAAKLQGMGTLGELNQAEEGEMSLANMSDQYGAMFSQDALKTGIQTKQEDLLKQVYGSGLEPANQAADAGRDLAAGIPVFKQILRDKGTPEELIPGLVSQYQQENAYKNDLYNADRDAATRDFKASLGKITSLDQLDAVRKEAAGMGNQIHQDKVNEFAENKLNQMRAEITWGQNQKLFNERLTPEQKRNAEITALQNQSTINTVSEEYDNTIDGVQTQLTRVLGYNPEYQAHLKKQFENGKVAVDLLDPKFQNNKVKGVINNKINQLAPEIGMVNANMIVYQAAKEAGKDKWFFDDGKIDKSIFDAAIERQFARYTDSVPLQNQLSTLQKEKESTLKQARIAGQIHAIKSQTGKNKQQFSVRLPAESKLIQTQQEVEDRNRQLDMEQQAAQAEEEKRNQHNLMAELNKVQSPPPPPTQNQKIGIGNVGPLKLPVVETPEGLRVQDIGGVLRELTQTELQEFGPQGIEHKFKRLMQGAGQTQVYTPPM